MQECMPFPYNNTIDGPTFERLMAISIASTAHLFSAGVTTVSPFVIPLSVYSSTFVNVCAYSTPLLRWHHHCKSLCDVYIVVFVNVCDYTEM